MKRIFIIAGEPSGDYLGCKLITDLKTLMGNRVEFFGIGGSLMSQHMNVFLPMSEITAIGISDVLPKLFSIFKTINRTVDEILRLKPDAVITIDSSGFTHRVNKKIKAVDSSIPIIHYVAPPVWAWRSWRAKKMPAFIDLLLTLFPFEPKYFDKFGLKSVFVGHPVANDDYLKIPTSEEKERFNLKYDIKPTDMVICCLPGSRDSELLRHVEVLNDVFEILNKYYNNIKYIFPTIPEKKELLNRLITVPAGKYHIITALDEKNIAMHVSCLAIAASGTVNLELARAGTPSIIIYKTSWLTAMIVRLLIKVKHVSIINIIAQKLVVPELLQENCTPIKVFYAIKKLVNSNDAVHQKEEFKKVINHIREPQSMLAAKEIINVINVGHSRLRH